jgi:hypothetical protein
MLVSEKALQLWLAPVRNLSWVAALFGLER